MPETEIEIKFRDMSKAEKANWLMSMDEATTAEDAKIDEIIHYNDKGDGFYPYSAERGVIDRLLAKGLIIQTDHGIYAVAYLCNL